MVSTRLSGATFTIKACFILISRSLRPEQESWHPPAFESVTSVFRPNDHPHNSYDSLDSLCSGGVGVSEAEDSQTIWKVEEVEEMRNGGNGAKGSIIYHKNTARNLLQARRNSCVIAYKAGRHGPASAGKDNHPVEIVFEPARPHQFSPGKHIGDETTTRNTMPYDFTQFRR
jgi:hypothetical protein